SAFLGQAYDPIWTDFDGRGTKVVPKLTDGQTNDVYDPFAGVLPEGGFQLSGGQFPADVTPARFDLRRSLLQQFDGARSWLEAAHRVREFDSHSQMAYSLLSSNKLREALDIHREPAAVRERYGMTLFGQSCLAAR